MKVRVPFLPLVFFAVATAATVIGCSGGSSLHSVLPPGASSLTTGAAGNDEESALVQRVAQSHQSVAGVGAYGEVGGDWIEARPAPGRPGYFTMLGGEVVPGPPDTSSSLSELAPQSVNPDVPAPAATMNCKTFEGNVPPPCTATGPFRRVYSGPGYSFALAHLKLPAAKITTMPEDPATQNGDIGYVYMEGWSTRNPDLGNSEFGFQYSAKYNNYAPYIRTDNPKKLYFFYLDNVNVRYLPSAPITFAFAGYKIGASNYIHVAVIGTTNVTCLPAGQKKPTTTCLGHGHELDNDWSPTACCIMARMTTIGQTNPNDAFYDGAKFGPISWSGVELAQTPPTPAPGSTILPLTGKEPPWVSVAAQNWPPAQAKIVAQVSDDTAETDTVNLAKLPALTLALNPATEQTVRPPTTVKYEVALSGAPKGYTFEYGWRLANPLHVAGDSLTVPGATPNPSATSTFVGPGTAATLNIGSQQGPYSLFVDAYLYFIDAAGKLTAVTASEQEKGGFDSASDQVEVGLKK